MDNYKCKDYKEDDFGVCEYKFEWDNETCTDNCIKNPTDKLEKKMKTISTIIDITNEE